jgi:hypothetical protein
MEMPEHEEKLPLVLIKHHTMKICGVVEVIAPLFLDLGTRQK